MQQNNTTYCVLENNKEQLHALERTRRSGLAHEAQHVPLFSHEALMISGHAVEYSLVTERMFCGMDISPNGYLTEYIQVRSNFVFVLKKR